MILQPTSLTPELTCVAFYMSSTPVTLLVFVGHFLTLVICGQKVHVERQSLAGESFHLSAPRFGRCELRSASRMAKKNPWIRAQILKIKFYMHKSTVSVSSSTLSSSSLVIHNNRDGLPSSPFRQLVAAKGSNFKASSWLPKVIFPRIRTESTEDLKIF